MLYQNEKTEEKRHVPVKKLFSGGLDFFFQILVGIDQEVEQGVINIHF